ncbi:MAG: flagellar basal body-associated protein FliL [Devosia sp.]|nr:flagellar basal body-associated protein FliL [Devosia sp.]
MVNGRRAVKDSEQVLQGSEGPYSSILNQPSRIQGGYRFYGAARVSKKPPKPPKGEKPSPDAEVDAEGADGAEGEGASAKKGPPLKLLIIAGAAVVLLGGGGGAGYFLFLKPKPAAHGEEHAAAEKKPKKKEEKAEGGKEDPNAPVMREGPDGVVFYTLPDLLVNMQSPDGRPTFLKLKLTLELPSEEVAEELTPNMPRMQDMFQSFLRELRPEDLSGSQGSYQLRMELLRRVGLMAAPQKVNAVLIEEMLIS